MSARDLLTVLLRALGIFFVVLNGAVLPGAVVETVGQLSSASLQEETGMVAAVYSRLISVLLGFALGMLLTWLASRIAARLCPTPETGVNGGAGLELTGGVLLRSGLSVLGVYIFFEALSPLAKVLVTAFGMGERETISDVVAKTGVAGNLAVLVACMAAGWVLVFRGHAVAAWLERFSPAAATGSSARDRGEP